MADVEIRVGRNGSYHVKGSFRIFDHKGNEINVDGEEVFLCRCGGSQDKPFCDGTHKKIEFKGPVEEKHIVLSGD